MDAVPLQQDVHDDPSEQEGRQEHLTVEGWHNKPGVGGDEGNTTRTLDRERKSDVGRSESNQDDDYKRVPIEKPTDEVLKLWKEGVRYTDQQKSKAWQETAVIVEKFSNEMVEQWNKEIDGLLTFAGLFSAILTAFNVESYQLLQPSPNDQTNAILIQVSAQLASFSSNSAFLNSTQPPFNALVTPSFDAPLYAIWLNCLWFASLIFSVASATLGIMVKQWLKEYSSGLYGTSREIARRRQYRLDNLIKWRVGMIVALIPVLLQVAVVLFLAGLVVLVHNIHPTVALVVTILVSVLVAIQLMTTILPAFSNSCCYYSPQAYGVFFVFRISRNAICVVVPVIVEVVARLFDALRKHFAFLRVLAGDVVREAFNRNKDLFSASLLSWRTVEQLQAIKNADILDNHILLTSYTASLDAGCIDRAGSCLMDNPIAHEYVKALLDMMHDAGDTYHWPGDTQPRFSRLKCSQWVHVAVLALQYPESWAQEWAQIRSDMVTTADCASTVALAAMAFRLDKEYAATAWKQLRQGTCRSGDRGLGCVQVVLAIAHRLATLEESGYTHEDLLDKNVFATFATHIETAVDYLTDLPSLSEDAPLAFEAFRLCLRSLRRVLGTSWVASLAREDHDDAVHSMWSIVYDLSPSDRRTLWEPRMGKWRELITDDLVKTLEGVMEEIKAIKPQGISQDRDRCGECMSILGDIRLKMTSNQLLGFGILNS